MSLITVNSKGLYCQQGDFYIDPWRPVKNAVITHVHADHARTGMKEYFCTADSEPLLKQRLGKSVSSKAFPYETGFKFNDVQVSFHSAGHILGSAQVRIEWQGEVWCITGDFKRDPDPSCHPFQHVECDYLITEATFGLPVYNWPDNEKLSKDIWSWWQRYEGPSLLFAYSLGKTQRIIKLMRQFTDEPIYLHGAAVELTRIYSEQGFEMGECLPVSQLPKDYDFRKALIIAPPSAHRSAWMKRFKEPQTAFASGWMQIRGNRRRRGYEQGFVVSDHADWGDLVETVRQSKARKVYVTHGQNSVFARFIREEMGIDSEPLETLFEGEERA